MKKERTVKTRPRARRTPPIQEFCDTSSNSMPNPTIIEPQATPKLLMCRILPVDLKRSTFVAELIRSSVSSNWTDSSLALVQACSRCSLVSCRWVSLIVPASSLAATSPPKLLGFEAANPWTVPAMVRPSIGEVTNSLGIKGRSSETGSCVPFISGFDGSGMLALICSAIE